MIWYDMILYDDMIWYKIWYKIWYIWYDMIWYDMIWYDMIWYKIWYKIWHIRYDIWYNMIRYDRIYAMIYDTIYDIWYYMTWYMFNCNWIATRWQSFSTHIHTNNTENVTKQTIHRTTQKYIEYIEHKKYIEQHKN